MLKYHFEIIDAWVFKTLAPEVELLKNPQYSSKGTPCTESNSVDGAKIIIELLDFGKGVINCKNLNINIIGQAEILNKWHVKSNNEGFLRMICLIDLTIFMYKYTLTNILRIGKPNSGYV